MLTVWDRQHVLPDPNGASFLRKRKREDASPSTREIPPRQLPSGKNHVQSIGMLQLGGFSPWPRNRSHDLHLRAATEAVETGLGTRGPRATPRRGVAQWQRSSSSFAPGREGILGRTMTARHSGSYATQYLFGYRYDQSSGVLRGFEDTTLVSPGMVLHADQGFGSAAHSCGVPGFYRKVYDRISRQGRPPS